MMDYMGTYAPAIARTDLLINEKRLCAGHALPPVSLFHAGALPCTCAAASRPRAGAPRPEASKETALSFSCVLLRPFHPSPPPSRASPFRLTGPQLEDSNLVERMLASEEGFELLEEDGHKSLNQEHEMVKRKGPRWVCRHCWQGPGKYSLMDWLSSTTCRGPPFDLQASQVHAQQPG